MDNTLKTELATMFAAASSDLRTYKEQVGTQQFTIELGQLLTDGDMTTVLAAVTAVATATVSNWAPVAAGLAQKVSTDSIPSLVLMALEAADDHEASTLFATLIVLLAAMKNARGL